MDAEELSGPGDDEEGAALIEALRQQQARQDAEREALGASLSRQQRQAGRLRSLALLASVGQNPLLQGLQRAASEQGGQLEGLSARTESRLAQQPGATPLALARLRLQALRPKVQREEAEKQRQFRAGEAEKNRQNARTVAAITAGDKALQQKLENEAGLRKELLGNKVVQEYQQAAVAFDKVRRAATDPSPAGDIALIFGFMKTLDPTSAVREGEFANAQNAGGIPQRIVNAYNRALSGERLSPAQRQEFVSAAESQFSATKQRAESLIGGYRGVAQDIGVSPERVVPKGTVVPDVDLNAPPTAPDKPARVQYSPSRNRTRELDAQGNVIREYEGKPRG